MRLKDATEYIVGETVEVSVTFVPEDGPNAGQPTNPTTVNVTLRDPHGAETQPSVDNPSAGVEVLTFIANLPGYWSYRIAGTGAAAGVFEGSVLVRRSRV